MNFFRWISLRPWFLTLVFLFCVIVLFSVFYKVFCLKEFKLKISFILAIFIALFLMFFFYYQELYSFELGELLEENVLLRDPQQLILSIYYQAAFWSIFLTLPLVFYTSISYFSLSFTKNILVSSKVVLASLVLIQSLVFIVVYRWVFPDWLISLNLLQTDNNDFYSFEPDIFRVYSVLFEEILDFILFSLVLSLFYFFSLAKVYFELWKNNRKFLFLLFFICSIFLVQQFHLAIFQFFMSVLVFDFRGFMFFLFYRLNIWKSK